jgi:putative nucleotidyltransferase with HDIG domain
LLWGFRCTVATNPNNIQRLLLTFKTLADLGPEITADRPFAKTARSMLSLLMEAVSAREGVLFRFSDRPALLTSVVSQGFALFPETAVVPLLPKHVRALRSSRLPQALTSENRDLFLSSNGNVAPDLIKCVVPLRVGPRLAGVVALGCRAECAPYHSDDLDALALISHHVAMALDNHNLSETLQQRISENLRLLTSLHGFYDHTLEAFAVASDVKDPHMRGHSMRVGRYAAAIGAVMGMDENAVCELRAAGYLHDIGKVSVDKHIFSKTTSLGPAEFQEMADHTVIGHEIVSGVQFPWPHIAESVRWHHERADGTGYPDRLLNDEVPLAVRIVAVADTFDAMNSERPYRASMGALDAMQSLARLAPEKLDGTAVLALVEQLRSDALGLQSTTLLDPHIAATLRLEELDRIAVGLRHRMNGERVYSA